MRAELSGLRQVAEDMLETVARSRLTPDRWERVGEALAAMSESLDRSDHDGFRRALFRLEDLLRVDRMSPPRKLTGGTTGPSEQILERKALIQDKLGQDERERERTEDQDEQ
ncbi:hypothetical protein QFZ55_006396 [Streptomyces luteogriseus]|uniref:CATRA system-associated protein n=1 Tax=Streptomyces luteogriseus TaxID=68233 RepID=UPI0027845D06|nr:CATRA system-associated protein [Streptomyces luteogriseus]MDQ0716944.1 hypothetical protein [Streptomyces luteogriseus]